MIIPLESLDVDTLTRIVESFITREGTDYGAVERSLDENVAAVMIQLKAGRVLIVFDEATESVNLVHTDEYKGT